MTGPLHTVAVLELQCFQWVESCYRFSNDGKAFCGPHVGGGTFTDSISPLREAKLTLGPNVEFKGLMVSRKLTTLVKTTG